MILITKTFMTPASKIHFRLKQFAFRRRKNGYCTRKMEEEHDHGLTKSQIALGALFGAACGDAVGAPLEHLGRLPHDYEVESVLAVEAMMWKGNHAPILTRTAGGGPRSCWAVGQCTDDTEMTISLARGLVECKDEFQIEKVAQEYGKWVKSGPPDMGITTGASIGCVLKGAQNSAFQKYLDQVGFAEAMKRACAFDNKGSTPSQSNGSLMRCTPIGIYGHKLSDEEIAHIVKEDGLLSHPHPSCLGAVTCYCLAVAHLVSNPGDRRGAFNRAKSWLERQEQKHIEENKEKGVEASFSMGQVKDWLNDAENDVKVPYYPAPGWVKIAFVHSFRHLLLGTSYVDALRETLLGGGDTDTNACIVGGLIGASEGIDVIPRTLYSAVLSCDTTGGKPRPDFLHSRHLLELASALLDVAPERINTSM